MKVKSLSVSVNKVLLICFAGFFFTGGAYAQSAFIDSLYAANESIYKFHFNSADSAIRILNNNYKGNYMPEILSANYYWWLIISGHDTPENRIKYYNDLNNSMSKLDHGYLNDSSNDSLYALITTYAYKARIHTLNDEYFSALKQLNSCIDLLKKSFGKEKDYEWFRLSSGLYNYYIEAVKKNYPFLLPYLLFLPEGKASLGLDMLQQASASKDELIQTEASYFLMKIYLEEERDFYKAEEYSAKLLKKYPGNLLYRYYRFKAFLKAGNIEQATVELGLLNHHAQKNQQVTEQQKKHFSNIAKKDLEDFYRKQSSR